MAHELEANKLTGKVEMMAVVQQERDVPWHRLGTYVAEAKSAKEAINLAGLDWTVSKMQSYYNAGTETEPMYVPAENQLFVVRDDYLAAIRDGSMAPDGSEILSKKTISKDYSEFQNFECFEFLDTLLDQGVMYDTAGALRGGRQIFMCAKLPRSIKVAGSDLVDFYIVLTSGHDGGSALTTFVGPVRVVCMNTLTMGLARAKVSWSMNHDSTMKAKIDEARKTLDLSFAYVDEFEKAAEQMLDRAITDEMFERLAAELYPVKKDNDPNRERQFALIGLRQRSATIPDEFRGTGWGAFNAVTEHVDHFAPYKNTASQTTAQRRATESLYGKTFDLREKAARLILDPKALLN